MAADSPTHHRVHPSRLRTGLLRRGEARRGSLMYLKRPTSRETEPNETKRPTSATFDYRSSLLLAQYSICLSDIHSTVYTSVSAMDIPACTNRYTMSQAVNNIISCIPEHDYIHPWPWSSLQTTSEKDSCTFQPGS